MHSVFRNTLIEVSSPHSKLHIFIVYNLTSFHKSVITLVTIKTASVPTTSCLCDPFLPSPFPVTSSPCAGNYHQFAFSRVYANNTIQYTPLLPAFSFSIIILRLVHVAVGISSAYESLSCTHCMGTPPIVDPSPGVSIWFVFTIWPLQIELYGHPCTRLYRHVSFLLGKHLRVE